MADTQLLFDVFGDNTTQRSARNVLRQPLSHGKYIFSFIVMVFKISSRCSLLLHACFFTLPPKFTTNYYLCYS